MKMFEVLLFMSVFLVGILIVFVIAKIPLGENTIDAGSATKFSERAAGTVWLLSEPEIKVSSKAIDNEFEYTVDATLKMKFDGKASSKITVMPVVLYKGEKVRDAVPSEIILNSAESKTARLQFKLTSTEPPIKILEKDTEFKCGSYTDDSTVGDCTVRHKQKLLLKNFLFDFKAFQIDPSELPVVPSIAPKIGPCVLNAEIYCPSDKRGISLKTPDEGKLCKDQEDEKDCRKDLKMCETTATVRLEKVISKESLGEKILPGAPSCIRDKAFAINIKVGEIERTKFEWKIGEDVSFRFWEKSLKKEQENCWQEDTPECKQLFIGEKITTISIETK